MANTLTIGPTQTRVSQLLPSVKCSNCAQQVSLDALGEHVCSPAAASPVSSRLQSPSPSHTTHTPSTSTVSHAPTASIVSTNSSSSFMPFITHPAAANPARISNSTPYESSLSFSPRVLSRSPIVPADAQQPFPSKSPQPPIINVPPRGSSISSTSSIPSLRSRSKSNIHPSSRPALEELSQGDMLSPQPRPSLDSARPPVRRNNADFGPSNASDDAGSVRPLGSPSLHSRRSPGPQERRPSNDNMSTRSMALPSHSPEPILVPIPPKSPGPSGLSERKTSNAGSSTRSMAPPSSVPFSPRSLGSVGSPVLTQTPPLQLRRPSNAGASSVRSMTMGIPPPPPRSPAPSASSGRAVPNRTPTPNASTLRTPPPPPQSQIVGPSLAVHAPSPPHPMALPLQIHSSPPSDPSAADGAPVNMAGVGRRAFWVAASVPPSPLAMPRPGDAGGYPLHHSIQGNNLKLHAPGSISSTGFPLDGPTPPLSPALTSSSVTSSGSQLRSPIGAPYQDPRQRADSGANSLVEDVRLPKRSATNSSSASGSSSLSSGQRQRGDLYKTVRGDVAREVGKPPVATRKGTQDSETSEVMLAYGRDSASEMSASDLASPMGSVASLPGVEEKITFPSFPPSPPQLPQLPSNATSKVSNRPSVVSISRSASSASVYSVTSTTAGPRGFSRSTPQGVDRRILQTLAEDPSTSGDGAFGLSALVMIDHPPPLPTSPPSASISIPTPRSPVMGAPRRSHTTPTSVMSKKKKGKEKVKDCVTCGKKIDDGRWVPVAAGSNSKPENDQGVLCENCWKKMYLPRCRRCDLPIEMGAISSSDGQLKGKYHKHCFTCTICERPFPDRSFYVHSNNPYCAYHYHEINSSLCADPTCGQPIEGPCAVSFDGKRRFHLDHFRCEWNISSKGKEREGDNCGRCDALLKECYWEVDGKVFCERHAVVSGVVTTPGKGRSWVSEDFHAFYEKGNDEGGGGVEHSTPGMTKGQKRTTRYMDLANNRF